MLSKRFKRHFNTWGILAIYAACALAAGLTLPRFEDRLFPGLFTPMSVGAATAIYSSIAAGMITLTSIVFSLGFVMVQFSATAYSPRLVPWLARDPVMSHALGIFTSTFLYAIAALAGVDRNGSGKVPFVSAWIVVVMLLASVGILAVLIQRIGLLQINRMLVFTGDQGRATIETVYPPFDSSSVMESADTTDVPLTQTVLHRGSPCSIQAVDIAALVDLATRSQAIIKMAAAVGDTVVESTPLLQVFGARVPINEPDLRDHIELGAERTFEQDPKYALRLLVDIAIRALSPAINDPTTAVQSLDQIEDLLVRLGERRLEIGVFRDSTGTTRLIVPFPAWGDLLDLAFDEICMCGANSMQVMRRMNALVADLTVRLPQERRPDLEAWAARVKSTISRSFVSAEERAEALREDRQGLGACR